MYCGAPFLWDVAMRLKREMEFTPLVFLYFCTISISMSEHQESSKLLRTSPRVLWAILWIMLLVWGGCWFFQNYGKFWVHRIAPKLFKPKIVFVIDDIGEHEKFKNELAKLGSKVTYAILPLRDFSMYFNAQGKRMHADVILHLPLETVHADQFPGQGLITGEMSDDEILSGLKRDLASVPGHVGVNNHMGSKGTSDRHLMTIILQELKREKLFFFDSHSTSKSVAPEICHAIGLPFLKCGIFLDNDNSVKAVKAQLVELRRIARDQGTAVAIGHYRKNTLDVLAEEIPQLEKEGFEIISLRNVLKIQTD